MVVFDSKTRLDLRQIASRSRLAEAEYVSALLAPGQAMEVTDEGDLTDVAAAFERQADRFRCENLECGPRQWRIRVRRVSAH